MTLAPWEYLFVKFDSFNFHDLFYPIWVAALVLLVLLLALYAIRTRQLRHHPPFLEMYEWLLWTGIIFYSWIVLCALFVFYFLFVLGGLIVGLATFVYIRFVRFPPMFAAYERQLAKQRYFDRRRFSHPETTIRSKASKRRRRR